ncbi:hypothetical protein ACROYT_G041576 [Oculina patagonica]
MTALKLCVRSKKRKTKKAILNTCRSRASKAAAQQQYTMAHKEVRRSIKRDWIMRTTTEGKRNGIQCTPWTQLEDLDFADDLALLSHNHD